MKKTTSETKALKNYMQPFPNPTPGKISIVALAPFSEARVESTAFHVTRKDFEQVRDCGFNAVMFHTGFDWKGSNYDNYTRAFEAISGTGLQVIVSGLQLMGNFQTSYATGDTYCRNLVNGFKDNTLLGAWQVMDQPEWTNFTTPDNDAAIPTNVPSTRPYINLPHYFDLVRDLDKTHPVFINLAASDAQKWIGTSSSYKGYLEYINRTISPDIWSYDFYPIVKKYNDGNIYLFFRREEFYKWLQIFSDFARETGKPFWAYCLSMSYPSVGLTYPIPTEGQLRLEAFSALAYGAQGIVYYRYAADSNNNPAPVDINGNKTLIWDTVKTVNEEISIYNDIFSGCNVTDVIRTFPGTTELKDGPIQYVSCSEEIIVSRIENNGKKYYVFVSTNPFASILVQFKKRIIFTGPSYAESPNMEQVIPGKPLSFDWVEIMFEPGGYGIISWP